MGVPTNLITPHREYLALGNNQHERLKNYQALFESGLDITVVSHIASLTNKGLVFGSELFKDQMEENLKRRVRPAKPGPKNNQLLL